MRNASDIYIPVDSMLAELETLIRFDTCFPPAADYDGFADLLQRLAAPLGGKAERVEIPQELWQAEGVHGRRTNLILRPDLGAPTAPEALIYFHTDTAPVGDGWTRPPLHLTREGDRLYGRGAADMKGCIVSVLAALKHLKTHETALHFRPILAFCTDEEGGRYPGIRHLAETRSLPDVLLNLNGSAAPRIWAGCFGSLDLSLTATGKAAHSGQPDGGINALEEIVPVLVALAGLKTRIETRISAMPPPPGADALCARLNVTACHAGDKGSALPGSCRLVVNRRYMPEEYYADVRREVEAAISQALKDTRLVDWRIDEVGHLPPVIDPDGPHTARWTAARAAAFGVPTSDFSRYGSGTSSDFGWVQRAGIQHMLLGGLSRPDRNVHGPDEFTTIEDLTNLARAVALFLAADFHPAADLHPDESPDQQGRTPKITEETLP